MIDALINFLFDKKVENKKTEVLTFCGENREIKKIDLPVKVAKENTLEKTEQKNKEEKVTSLSKYFVSLKSLYAYQKGVKTFANRKANLQSHGSYQKRDFLPKFF